MTINVTSPVTGSAQTGLTSPTYTIVADTPPNAYSKQWAVTALGGTQTGVDVHGASKPFTITCSRPAQVKPVPVPNASTGLYSTFPRNVYALLTRKGAAPVTGQVPQVLLIRTEISVVAGQDLIEPEDVRAALSLHIGALSQQSAGIGDTVITNLL